MQEKILLTRAKEDNQALQEILSFKGYIPVECNLISHVHLPFDPSILDDFTDIIITSKRAAVLLPDAACGKNGGSKNIWVVGDRSAEVLRQKNYSIKYVALSAKDLKRVLPVRLYSSMVYLASNRISTKMPNEIKTVEVYKVRYKKTLSTEELQLLKNDIKYILLYSENCAKTLINLIIKNNLWKYLENSVVITISSKVQKLVKDYFKTTISATSPADMSTQILKLLEYYDKK